MERLMTHDLLRLRQPIALSAEGPIPSWVEAVLRRTPWVVVRRGRWCDGRVLIGVRGPARSERFAALVSVRAVEERLSPEDLIVSWHTVDPQRTTAVQALAALARVAPLLSRLGRRWGPGGSVGFELATGVPCVSPSSDLDLILRQERRLEPDEAVALHAALLETAAPVRVDVLLETPSGGVALADLAARPERVLVRTADGPRLLADPWEMDPPSSRHAPRDEAPSRGA
jgi:phosphoribosyl-dephospho-CoA transferase